MISFKIKEAIELVNQLFHITYPVDLEGLCRELGIEVKNNLDLKNDGYLYIHCEKKVLFVSSKIKNEQRKRFVIAHELGHYFLHNVETLQACSAISMIVSKKGLLSQEFQEQEANQFASYLLLPQKELELNLLGKKISLQVIEDIAKKYNVSLSVSGIRCTENSNSCNETLLCYEKGSLKWFSTGDTLIEKQMLPQDLPPEVEYNMQRFIKFSTNGEIWKIYSKNKNVKIEFKLIYNNTYLILLDGKRIYKE